MTTSKLEVYHSRSSRTKEWFSQFIIHPKKIGSVLFLNALNPTHVPFSSANSRTLGSFFTSRIWWVDIEVPNDSVDKSSWESSACYPRRTFDPLSESPSTRDSRITMADFRLCSTSRSHSQAGLYHYAHEQNLSLSLPSHTSVTL